jgi:hypothetical protein
MITDEERNAEIAARNGADSGTKTYDTLLITGNGLKNNDWAGDTFDTVYQAWNKVNPHKMNKSQFRDWYLKNNAEVIINVKDCNGNASIAPNVPAGKVVKLPEGNEITELAWKWACEKPTKPIEAMPAQVPEAFVPQPVGLAMAEAAPLAQFVPPSEGANKLGYAMQRYNYFFGTPPRDAAARGDENEARLRNGALRPDEMEGQAVKLRKKDDKTNALAEGQDGKFFFGRARTQELTYAPEATYLRDGDGNLIPNKRFNQKLEDNIGNLVASDLRVIEATQGGALISVARRNNPYHAGIFTDFDTSRNIIGKWNATPEALDEITKFEAVWSQYPKVAARFEQSPNAADAKALLDMNERLALSPIVWSVSSRGVPVGNIEAVQEATRNVLASPAFAALSAEEQQGLKATYESRIGLYSDHNALKGALGGDAGAQAMYNPLDGMVADRAALKFIGKGYGADHDKARPDDVSKAEWRTQQAAAEGTRYAAELNTLRTPTAREYEIGSGAVFNTARQSTDQFHANTGAVVGKLRNDPALLDDYITYLSDTPGALQKVTDLAFHASRKGAKDNKTILDFTKDSQADRFAQTMGETLAGEVHRNNMDYRGQSILNGVANSATFGLATPGANRNQNRGLFVKEDGNVFIFSDDFKERWQNGTPEQKDAIRQFIGQEFLGKVEAAHGKGVYYASTAIAEGLTERTAENARVNGGQGSETYRRIEAKLGKQTLSDIEVAGKNATENLGGGVMKGTQMLATQGKVVTVSEEELNAAQGGTIRTTNAAALAAGVRLGATVLPTDVAAAARSAGEKALAISTSSDTSRVLQAQVNNETVLTAAAAQPTVFSLTLLEAAATGKLDAGATKSLSSYLSTVDKGTKDANNYADLMKHHLKAYLAAGDDVAARATAENAAATELAGYFAAPDSKHPGAKADAASRLAGLVAKDGAISAAFTAQLKEIAASQNAAGGAELTPQQSTQLQAALVVAKTPEEKAAALQSVLAGSPATLNAGTNSAPLLSADAQTQLLAVAGSSASPAEKAAKVDAVLADQVKAGGTSLTAAQTDALKATINANGADLNSTLAGFGKDLNAGKGLPAGAVNTMLELNSGTPSRDVLAGKQAEFFAGHHADVGSLPAHPGTSWRAWVKVIVPFIVPGGGGGGDIPFLPELPDYCGGALRPLCPVRPVPPSVPGVPGGGNGI